jgi:hypothetical protein
VALSIATPHGIGSYHVDSTCSLIVVRAADGGQKATQLGGSSPESLARILMSELAHSRPED